MCVLKLPRIKAGVELESVTIRGELMTLKNRGKYLSDWWLTAQKRNIR